MPRSADNTVPLSPEELARIRIDQEHANREAIRKGAAENPTKILPPPKITPTADQIDGARLLGNVEDFLARFIAYPSDHARVAHVLWIAHTHAMDAWESTPRIAFLSPEPGSGKTRALEISELLVPRPVEAINATPAFLFRRISDKDGLPTILFDEIDTLFGAKAKDHEEIRGVLNAGHRRGAVAGRCVVRGKVVETEELPAFCAVAMAGLGNLPDTLLSRSVVVKMRRRAPSETVEPYRRRIEVDEGHTLRDRLAVWAEQETPRLAGVYPDMPDGIADRDADVWEALLAIADAADGAWPARARVAAVAHVADAKAATPSLGVQLLSDLRAVFGTTDTMSTSQILEALTALPESPWGDLRGKPLDPRRLANYLRPYGVRSTNIRCGSDVVRGYKREDLHDPWLRYLGAAPSSLPTTTTSTTHTTSEGEGDLGVAGNGATTSATPTTANAATKVTSDPWLRFDEANAHAHCGRCQHFTPGSNENGLGSCAHFGCETWPAPNPGCTGYSPRNP